MTANSLISICIPAYKNTDFLKRLLDSIAIQRYRDFEVIVTDDSPDQAVGQLCADYASRFTLHYSRNSPSLGMPANWNAAVSLATGDWIKIMHDDDWFATGDSLHEYAQTIAAHPEANFVFSAYRDIFLDEDRSREMFVPRARYRAFLRDKTILFGRNIVGPPSVVLYRRLPAVPFDPRVRWLVDIEFYIRYLATGSPVYIDKILVNVGLGKEQVTQDCFRQRLVEIPENFYLLDKVGYHHLKNIFVYDAWWRLMRNLEIRRKEDITDSGFTGWIPPVILSMVKWQSRLPLRFWKIGALSKIGMLLNYLINYYKIPA
jgi:glycosyltransferase involved in cell wall biosynthesis